MIHRRENRYSSAAVYVGWALFGLAGLGALMAIVELWTRAGGSSILIIWASVAVCAGVAGQILAHKRDVFRCDECGALRVATPGAQRRRGVASLH